MNLQCNQELGKAYKSNSQIARVLTEDWCTRELYCPSCESDRLRRAAVNTQAIDFRCPQCEEPFQLKSTKNWAAGKLVDAGYEAMMRAIRTNRTPNLLLLNYSPDWTVQNLLLIPKFFISETVVEPRPPLTSSARRAGWVGCNILLSQIPTDGRIAMVANGQPTPSLQVRRCFSRFRSLADLKPHLRGWTLDTLRIVRKLNQDVFLLRDLYAREDELQKTHPKNRNVKPKIRQQLQILRDLGIITFVSPGRYSIVKNV